MALTASAPAEARAKVNTYRDLIVWQRAMDLALACHQLGASLLEAGHEGPGDELQRTAILVPSRIATGHGRPDRPGFLELLAQASLALRTVETQLLLLQRLELVPTERLTDAFTLATTPAACSTASARASRRPEPPADGARGSASRDDDGPAPEKRAGPWWGANAWCGRPRDRAPPRGHHATYTMSPSASIPIS